MLCNACKYAIRAVIYIALKSSAEHKIGIKEIAGELEMPEYFLGKIMQKLARKNVVKSLKGPNGGYYLSEENNHVSLYDIVVSIEGPEIFEQCLISFRHCYEEEKPCPIHNDYVKVRNEIIGFYKDHFVKDIAEEIKNSGNEIVL